MRRPQGVFNYGGGKELIPGKKIGKFGQGIYWQVKETLEADLARRPRWGGGALRACRRAEIIADV